MENKKEMKKITCPYCSVNMLNKGVKRIGGGKLKFLLEKIVPENFAVLVYECPKCGKLEFFRLRPDKSGEKI